MFHIVRKGMWYSEAELVNKMSEMHWESDPLIMFIVDY